MPRWAQIGVDLSTLNIIKKKIRSEAFMMWLELWRIQFRHRHIRTQRRDICCGDNLESLKGKEDTCF